MISFDEARLRIMEKAIALPRGEAGLADALSCVLAEDIIAPIDLPLFDNSAMDGFAVAHSDCESRLRVSQTIRAGVAPRPLERGTCARIMTGAPIPDGADTVVPIEDTDADGDSVRFREPIREGQHVRYTGEDMKSGEIAAKCGVVVTPRLITLLAALGLDRVTVRAKPRVSIITTGSELAPRGTPLAPGKIYDSNGIALVSALSEIGIIADSATVEDDEGKVIAALDHAICASDILLTVGGVSVGDFDHVKITLEKMGVHHEFWKVAIKPGKPLFFGTLGKKLIFGLPGNPVSCMMTFDLFVHPAILKMMGHVRTTRRRRKAIAGCGMKGSKGKTDLLRGIARDDAGRLCVTLSGVQGSAMLKSFADSNCVIFLPEEIDHISEGETVEMELYE